MQYVENEQSILEEALRRGASLRLLVTWLFWRRTKSRQGPLDTPGNRQMRIALAKMVEPQFRAYRIKITAEFGTLRVRFGDPDRQRTDLEHYQVLRPMYYILGYTEPARDIFNRIRQYHFLGKLVPGGVHDAFMAILTNVEPKLRVQSPDLPARVAAAITAQDGGFVPRNIAGTNALSNHAFGLAIDIDPASNPHIKKAIIPVLNEVVSTRAGVSFDFGQSYTKQWSRLVTDEQRIWLMHANARTASRAVQVWLQQNLPTYEDCIRRIDKPISTTDAQVARQTIDEDRDLTLIDKIIRRYGRSTDYPSLADLRGWSKTGIQTIPVELAIAVMQATREAGYSKTVWGQDYEHSKDAMHFEINAADAIRPDSNPRKLEDLFPPEFRPFAGAAIYSPELDRPWPETGLFGLD